MELKYRVYSEIDQRYITNKVKWAIPPSGRLIDYQNKKQIRGCILEPFTGCYDKYDNEVYLNDVLVVTSGVNKGFSATVFFHQGAYMVTTPGGVPVPISPVKYLKVGTCHDLDIDDKVNEVVKDLLKVE